MKFLFSTFQCIYVEFPEKNDSLYLISKFQIVVRINFQMKESVNLFFIFLIFLVVSRFIKLIWDLRGVIYVLKVIWIHFSFGVFNNILQIFWFIHIIESWINTQLVYSLYQNILDIWKYTVKLLLKKSAWMAC